ncbi:hypothetical protein [Streptomyces mirabilis]|uniref:hypothetical protein n=1 Tax=Streptomyces mirabilis TaxID=68239 RepID=UPI0033C926B9
MTAPTTLRLHWIMTVQYGPETSTLSNTAEVDAASSRTEVYRDLRAHVAQKIGTHSFVVLYFALEPDQL